MVTIEDSQEDSLGWTSPAGLPAEDVAVPFPYFKLLVIMEGLLGVGGNALVLAVFFIHKKLQKLATSFLLLHQTLVDLLCALMLILTYSYKWSPPQFSGLSGALGCHLLESEVLLWSFLNISTFSLILLTLERYFKVVWPIFHHNYYSRWIAVTAIVASWVAGLIWNFAPTASTTKVVDGKCLYLAFWPSDRAQRAFGVIYIFFAFFLPIIIFAYSYAHMLYVLRKIKVSPKEPASPNVLASSSATVRNDVVSLTLHQSQDTSQHRNDSTVQDEGQVQGQGNYAGTGRSGNHGNPGGTRQLSSPQRNITKMLVTVTLAFLVCWLPNQIHYLLYNFGFDLSEDAPLYRATLFMCFGNCCINPVIYVLKYEEFKVGLRMLYNKCRRAP